MYRLFPKDEEIFLSENILSYKEEIKTGVFRQIILNSFEKLCYFIISFKICCEMAYSLQFIITTV